MAGPRNEADAEVLELGTVGGSEPGPESDSTQARLLETDDARPAAASPAAASSAVAPVLSYCLASISMTVINKVGVRTYSVYRIRCRLHDEPACASVPVHGRCADGIRGENARVDRTAGAECARREDLVSHLDHARVCHLDRQQGSGRLHGLRSNSWTSRFTPSSKT